MKLLRTTLLLYVAGFALFTGLRFVTITSENVETEGALLGPMNIAYSDFSSGQRNIATQKRSAAAPAASDQKYEQIANIGAGTKAFEEDEARARAHVEAYAALIQFEQRSGLAGYRRLQLAIGVAPASFDDLVEDLKKLGEISRLQIDKTDKTNEYRDLQAQKVSLEKSRDSLIELKSRDGDVNELINLENRILGLEQEIQALGVNLGDFDAENEFSTVKLSLIEKRQRTDEGSGVLGRLLRAAIWTAQYYTLLWVGFAAALLSVFVFLKLLAMTAGVARLLDRSLTKD
ncbi:MAG: DUF4349 domain-containing protein [Pseudomonadota bacterium]